MTLHDPLFYSPGLLEDANFSLYLSDEALGLLGEAERFFGQMLPIILFSYIPEWQWKVSEADGGNSIPSGSEILGCRTTVKIDVRNNSLIYITVQSQLQCTLKIWSLGFTIFPPY